MLRTKAVKLTVIPAVAYRVKLNEDRSLTLIRDDYSQPGIAAISRTTGEPIPAANVNLEKYPMEAFKEAIELTRGLPYKKGKGAKVEKGSLTEKKEKPVEEVVIDMNEYQMILDKYTDKNGKFSYDLLNKDFIKFAKSSTVVKRMIEEENATPAKVKNYVVSNKIRNITGNDKLTGKEIKKIVEMLDEIYPKSVFKELTDEIRKMVAANKKKQQQQ